MMSTFGLTANTALPARSAARRQSVAVPVPHVAEPCGSFFRSKATTLGVVA